MCVLTIVLYCANIFKNVIALESVQIQLFILIIKLNKQKYRLYSI